MRVRGKDSMCSNVELIPLNIENINKLLKGHTQIKIKSMKELLSSKEVLRSLELIYGIVYNFDSLDFGDIEDLVIDMDNIMEARYFNEQCEINFHIEDEEIVGNIVIDRGEKELLVEEELLVYKKHSSQGNKYKKLTIKKYINFDEDNEAYFYYMKPCSFIKEAK